MPFSGRAARRPAAGYGGKPYAIAFELPSGRPGSLSITNQFHVQRLGGMLAPMTLTTLLIILLVLAAVGGGWGWGGSYGWAGWSPVGVILIIFLVLYLTGRL